MLTLPTISLQVGGLLGGLMVIGALTLQQTQTLITTAAAAKGCQGHMAAGDRGYQQHVMRGAISVLAQWISPAELQQLLKVAGLQLQHTPAKVSTRETPKLFTKVVWAW